MAKVQEKKLKLFYLMDIGLTCSVNKPIMGKNITPHSWCSCLKSLRFQKRKET